MNSITSEIALPGETSAVPPPKSVADPTRLVYLTALGVILSLVLALSVPTWTWLWPVG